MPKFKTWLLNFASINPYEHVLNVAIFDLSADSSNENPYEDIELESQCSQQSLPSSPGADSTKVPAVCARHDILQWWRFLPEWLNDEISFSLQSSRPGFFRQNSARSFKLLDLRRSNQSTHSTSSGAVPSSPQLSPPSTPTGPEHTSWLPGDPYSRTCRRIPTVCVWVHILELYMYFLTQNPSTWG